MQTVPARKLNEIVVSMLLELGIPAHRVGYSQLRLAIAHFANDKHQSVAGELYPRIAQELGYPDWKAVEQGIRKAILHTWENGDRLVWKKYFPGCKTVPSNKQFIATLAEHIK